MVSERWFCQDGEAEQEMTDPLEQDAERSHPQSQAGCREQANWKWNKALSSQSTPQWYTLLSLTRIYHLPKHCHQLKMRCLSTLVYEGYISHANYDRWTPMESNPVDTWKRTLENSLSLVLHQKPSNHSKKGEESLFPSPRNEIWVGLPYLAINKIQSHRK